MKKMMKTALALAVLCLSLVMSMTIFAADGDTGLVSSAKEYYFINTPLSVLPSTYEATVYFPADYAAGNRGGVIYGNYDGSNNCVNFEIYSNGNPRLYIFESDRGLTHNHTFTDINVYNGKETHIAIVKDSSAGTVSCYIDGELKQTLATQIPESVNFSTGMVLGGDRRAGNGQNFKGKILDFAIFEDVRTAQEISADCMGLSYDEDGLMAAYDMSTFTDTTTDIRIGDLSGNGNDFIRNSLFLDDVDVPENFDYSFAVVGDTQIINRAYPMYMTKIYDWLVDNAEDNNLKFVFGLGDITDTNTEAEWALAKAVVSKMDGVVPYSIVRGNHDGKDNFTSFFPYNGYHDRASGSYDGTSLNTYQFFMVEDIKYLVFTLDYGASDKVLGWVSGIIEDNPDSNVIITTHAYLYRDGTTLDAGDVCPPTTSGGYNNGDDMWDKLVSKHENIVLVLSGHDPCDYVVLAQDKGEKGNVVSQLLVDPQGTDNTMGGAGLVAMLYFSNGGKHVDVRYYSTVENKYYLKENQFSFDINVIEAESDPPVVTSMDIRNISFDVTLYADSYEGSLMAVLYDRYGKIISVKRYEAAEKITVTFPKYEAGCKAQVFYWNGVDTLTSLGAAVSLGITE